MFIPITTLILLLPSLLAQPVKRATGQHITAGRDGLCLSIFGGAAAVSSLSAGVSVVSLPCDQASTWDLSPGQSDSIYVSGNRVFVLDAGSNPGNNGGLKVWTSYPGLFQQTWFITGDNRIAITGGNQCLDEGDNGIQTYQCTTGNTNQVFYTSNSGSGSTPPPTTPNQPSSGHTKGQIYWNSDPTSCLSLVGGNDASGQYVALTECFAQDSPFLKFQTWNVNSSNGRITTPNGFCLDAGVNPQNYNEVKVWTCYEGLEQQNWSVQGNGNLIAVPNGQCLDVIKESNAFPGDPYGTTKEVEMYACSVPDPQQAFTYVQ